MGASGRPGRSFLMQGKGALTHHQPGAGGGTACGSRAPSGGGSAGVVLPCPVYTSRRQRRLVHRTQLRRCAGGLGGRRPPTSGLGVYTQALLATTISAYKIGLKDACDGGILCLYQFGKSEFIVLPLINP